MLTVMKLYTYVFDSVYVHMCGCTCVHTHVCECARSPVQILLNRMLYTLSCSSARIASPFLGWSAKQHHLHSLLKFSSV